MNIQEIIVDDALYHAKLFLTNRVSYPDDWKVKVESFSRYRLNENSMQTRISVFQE